MVKSILVREASELGFPVGKWPVEVTVEGVSFMYYRSERDRENGTTVVIYRSVAGRELHVLND
jgi:hypothetical protein